jgi:hypothetical protein
VDLSLFVCLWVFLSVDIVRVFASTRDGDVSFEATACSCGSLLPGTLLRLRYCSPCDCTIRSSVFWVAVFCKPSAPVPEWLIVF